MNRDVRRVAQQTFLAVQLDRLQQVLQNDVLSSTRRRTAPAMKLTFTATEIHLLTSKSRLSVIRLTLICYWLFTHETSVCLSRLVFSATERVILFRFLCLFYLYNENYWTSYVIIVNNNLYNASINTKIVKKKKKLFYNLFDKF